MIAIFFAYFTTFFVVIKLIKLKRNQFKPFPKLEINRNGISFNSTAVHRLKIGNAKILEIGDSVFLKKNKKLVSIHNISNIRIEQNFLYFKALGKVIISIEANKIYRYFNIIIKSNKFNIFSFQQLALLDILNNIFNLDFSVALKKYLNFINNILNIEIDDKKVKVCKNKFNLNFELIYRINNNIKRVKVYESL